MEIRIGPPATGPNFYKRPLLIGNLLRALKRGNLAFLGPRRTGKTSCLEEIRANPTHFIPILINLEEIDTVEAWLNAMINDLREALEKPQSSFSWAKEGVAGVLKNLEKIEIPAFVSLDLRKGIQEPPWRKTADAFLKLLAESDVPVLFLLDEFPTFLKLVARKISREEVESVLNWFRAARNDLKDRQARFLVTGSIGLKGVVKSLGLAPAVNDFDTYEIPPLLDAEAHGLLGTLAADHTLPLTDSGRTKILELLGTNWPILLQLFISEIQEADFRNPPTNADLESIYREKLVHGSRNKYCDGMYDRLTDTFAPSEAQLAREILKATCRSADGVDRESFDKIHSRLVPESNARALVTDELDHVIDTLKHDGYLRQLTSGQQLTIFASNILRDFWLRKTS
ncbi:MAG: ATP-binding protein [Verrucomicrobiaceae bacterium]|nr:MAG: ATP-binding protein [Verrucomicrobiaceae bacterium]